MYKWRHYQVLEEMGSVLKSIIKHANEILTPASSGKFIPCVKEGDEVLMSTVKIQKGLLAVADDWSILLDL